MEPFLKENIIFCDHRSSQNLFLKAKQISLLNFSQFVEFWFAAKVFEDWERFMLEKKKYAQFLNLISSLVPNYLISGVRIEEVIVLESILSWMNQPSLWINFYFLECKNVISLSYYAKKITSQLCKTARKVFSASAIPNKLQKYRFPQQRET